MDTALLVLMEQGRAPEIVSRQTPKGRASVIFFCEITNENAKCHEVSLICNAFPERPAMAKDFVWRKNAAQKGTMGSVPEDWAGREVELNEIKRRVKKLEK